MSAAGSLLVAGEGAKKAIDARSSAHLLFA